MSAQRESRRHPAAHEEDEDDEEDDFSNDPRKMGFIQVRYRQRVCLCVTCPFPSCSILEALYT